MGFVERILSETAAALALADGLDVSVAFHAALEPHGATYLQSRVYERPAGPLTSENHWRAGGVIARISRPEWPGSSAHNYICFDCNPLLAPVRSSRGRWRFSDYAARNDPAYRAYWDAMGEGGIGDAAGVIVRGDGGRLANIHVGMADRSAFDDRYQGLSFATLLLGERLLELDQAKAAGQSPLTTRESDCLAYVASGKTDWEISVILGVSQTTVRFHIDNARRKLDASSRAHAVAKLAVRGLL